MRDCTHNFPLIFLINSVKILDFQVNGGSGQCLIKQLGNSPWFYGTVTGALVVLTGKQRDINGQLYNNIIISNINA